jgi:hypothetical protein
MLINISRSSNWQLGTIFCASVAKRLLKEMLRHFCKLKLGFLLPEIIKTQFIIIILWDKIHQVVCPAMECQYLSALIMLLKGIIICHQTPIHWKQGVQGLCRAKFNKVNLKLFSMGTSILKSQLQKVNKSMELIGQLKALGCQVIRKIMSWIPIEVLYQILDLLQDFHLLIRMPGISNKNLKILFGTINHLQKIYL